MTAGPPEEVAEMFSSDRCPHCNTRVPRVGTRCPVCGAPVSARRPYRSAEPTYVTEVVEPRYVTEVVTRFVPPPSREERPTHRPDDGGSEPPGAA